MVEGRLQLDKWETENGEKRSRIRVKADRVQFLGRPRTESGVGDMPVGASMHEDEEGIPY